MATAGNASAGGESNGAGSNNVPQWKRDLIQRRRQQNKVLSSNGASVKLCSAVTGTVTTSGTSMTVEGVDTAACRQEQRDASSTKRTPMCEEEKLAVNNVINNNEAGSVIVSGGGNGGVGGGTGTLPATPTSVIPIGGRGLAGGATGIPPGGNSCEVGSVARNMRLEADLSLCSDSEDVVNGGGGSSSGAGGASNRSTDMERKQEHSGDDYESEEGGATRRMTNNSVFEELRGTTSNGNNGGGTGGNNITGGSRMNEGDAESDSSEELQYGPGIVNKLKSKYLNLALRETNKSRATVQRFRRAASLEDLLDREDEPSNEKNNGTSVSGRKYAKRNVPGQTGKTGGDRYRNANRGNDTTMKRARSVETLVRYNNTSSSSLSSIDDSSLARTSSRIAPRPDPVNDHIVLVDRSTVKIESRLSEIDRPKPANKPKRIKPVLAETERPPPDLVKTTMRIFEGSAKKLKPKGEVAAKVATFKTINDTFKAQNQKKVLPKPPLQPKPFVNGNARTTNATSSSPKKIVLPQKPTAELIETDEEFHFDGVITDPIVQSVSSVVSKFQQIEKSHSPSPSPEPTFNKLRFSPAPSPEPQNRSKLGALEIGVKSPPLTPLLSPRIASPGIQSPTSPIKDTTVPSLSNVSPIRKLSPARDVPEMGKFVPTRSWQAMEKDTTISVSTRQRVPSPERNEILESPAAKDLPIEKADVEEQQVEVENGEDQEDGPKTISSSALDNIGKAGTTMRFRFNEEPNVNKNYLPGTPKQNGRKLEERPVVATKLNTNETKHNESSFGSLQDQEIASRLLRERLAPEKEEKRKNEDNNGEIIDENKVAVVVESKPPKSVSLITSTTTSYPQGNESKTIRCQKSESSPPQKQIGIIRPLVSTKTQHPQQNLSNRELEKNLINRVKSIEQPTKVVVSLKSADEIQPTKKSTSGGGGGGGVGGGGGGGLWDGKPWNQQNNTMVFNFSNRKDVPDYIENDGYIVKRKREKPKVGDGGIIVLDATLDASTTDDGDSAWELLSPPSPCDVSFLNDNILINGRSNLSRTPRNHKHRIQFDDTATRTFEYPSEASMLEGEGNSSSVDGETSASAEQSTQITNKTSTAGSTTSIPSLLGGGGLASYTPSKVDLASEGFELGVTRATPTSTGSSNTNGNDQQQQQRGQNVSEVDYLKPAQDGGAWGSETTGDLLY